MSKIVKPAILTAMALWLLSAAVVSAQSGPPGPITPPPEHKVKRIPRGPAVEPPPIPPEEILQKVVAKEDAYAKAFQTYTYRLAVRIVEYDAQGETAGEAKLTTDIYTKENGERVGRTVDEPEMGLKQTDFTRGDLLEFVSLPQFVLTSDQIFKYDIVYVGKQKVDEIDAYAFNVKPRSVDRRERRFEGVVWVDDRDLEIVKTYGRFVTEVTPDEPFLLFESYREVVDAMRLPTYVRSDGEKQVGEATVPLRLTLRYSDYTPPKSGK
ncbi:MAG: hypothetical protein ACRD5W_07005 [Candidatus Acidiferrales bacterium]